MILSDKTKTYPKTPLLVAASLFFSVLMTGSLIASTLPAECNQLLVGIADDWDNHRGSLYRLERSGSGWKQVHPPIPALFGRNGVAWGLGLTGHNAGPGPNKREGDGRAPAGIFSLGKVYTYERSLPRGSDYPFHTVTEGDCWIEDPAHPQYNQHVRVDPANPPAWFAKQQMKQGDYAHHWKVEIHHNSGPIIPGAGSSIFFHIRRGPDRPSAGCTTMEQTELLSIIQWLREDRKPHYVLLPRAEYERLQEAWKLPAGL